MIATAGEFRPLTKEHESDEDAALRRVANAVHQLNEAVIRAVGAGLSVELVRTSRFHDQAGNWGDQMVPMIREKPAPRPV